MRKPYITPVRILFGYGLWDGLMASKLQFNAQETTGYVFPAKATKGGSTGLCVFTCGGAVSRVVSDYTVFFFLGEDKASAQLG